MKKIKCIKCDKKIIDNSGFVSDDWGDVLCEECGEEHLTLPDIIRDSEYPYIDVENYGTYWKRRDEK